MRLLATASGLMAVADTLTTLPLASDAKFSVVLDCLYLVNCVFGGRR